MINLKRKIYLTSFIFIFLILVLLFCFISPLFSTIKKDSSELLSQKEKLFSLLKKRENLKSLQEEYLALQPNLEKIDSFFADSQEPIDFISFLEKTAKAFDLPIQISLTGEEIKKTIWPSLFFQIKVSSALPNFMKFLEKLELAPYLIEVDGLTIERFSRVEVKPGTKKMLEINYIQATLDIRVYTK